MFGAWPECTASINPAGTAPSSAKTITCGPCFFGGGALFIPADFRAKIQEYVDGYVLYDHVVHGGRNPTRMEELGLTDYAIRRFALANPGDWIARIEEIAEAGATQIWVSPSGGNLDSQLHYMRILGEQIMARFLS